MVILVQLTLSFVVTRVECARHHVLTMAVVIAYLKGPTGWKCDQFVDSYSCLRLLMFAEVECCMLWSGDVRIKVDMFAADTS